MATPASGLEISTPAPLLGWRRLRLVLLAVWLVSLPLYAAWTGSYWLMLSRLLIAGLALLLVFGLCERWPARLPAWLERWAWQVLGVALAVPFAMILAYLFTSGGYETSFWRDSTRQGGFAMLLGATLLFAPWVAMLGLLRRISGESRNRALAFELERSELERQALDARMRVLQAQVEPHFLFNTLANVRELVDSGSPQASAVLANLIAYLRAAVPRLQSAASLAQEMELVRAYLELMQMRMPDRLSFVLHAEQEALLLPFPSMALLTLVENAVRHGIDPSEEGGRIEVRVSARDGQCRVQVLDTGVGLGAVDASACGTGTGLANLRERLRLLYGEQTLLRLDPVSPRGTSVELEFPLGSPTP